MDSMPANGQQQAHGAPSRAKAWVALAIVAAAILAARLAFAFTLPGPWYLPDEVTYLEQAHAAAEGTVFSRGLFGAGQPGWPMLLAPVVGLLEGRPDQAYAAGVALASLLGTAVAIPLFLLVRRTLDSAEAVAAAALAVVLPGSCLLGWTVLSESLFTLLVVCAAAWFMRALRRERAADFAVAAGVAAFSYWVRPFGAACVLACLAGTLVWAVQKRRWRQPLAALAATAALAAIGPLVRTVNGYPTASFTNYGGETEQDVLQQILVYLSESRGWRSLGLAVARDLAYLFVATLGVFLPLALAAGGRGVAAFRGLDARGRASLVAGAVLFAAMVGITALARLGTDIQESSAGMGRMYGRYVEPLVPLVIAAGAVAWRRMATDRHVWRGLLALVLALVVVLGLAIPRGATSFTNSPGIWSWYLIYQHVPTAAALAVPAALAAVFWLLRGRRAAAILTVLGAGVVSTALVGAHIYHYNAKTQPWRELAAGAAQTVRNDTQSRAGAVLWIDPRLCGQPSPFAQEMMQIACWLRADLLAYDMRLAQAEQVVSVGDLLLTRAADPGLTTVWEYRGLRVIRIPQAGRREFAGGSLLDPPSATGQGLRSLTDRAPDPGR